MDPASSPSSQPPFDRPFTRAEFVHAGHDHRLLRLACYRQLLKGVWVHVDRVDATTGIRAALAAHPEGAVASHFSAARLYDLPVPEHPFEHVMVFRDKDRRRRSGVKSHVTKRLKRVRRVRGIPVLDPVTVFIQLAGHLSLVDLVVLGDALVRDFGISPSNLLTLCRRSGDYYAKRAAEATEYVRSGVGSPTESILRMLLVLAGLPEPEVDFQLRDSLGNVLRRFDLYYAEGRVLVEYDGRHHARDAGQWHSDLERREELDTADYRLLVVTADGIYREPARTLERVHRVLVARGVPGVGPIQDGWREYFPAWSRTTR